MRKLFVLLAVTVASVSVASAQDWGAGARMGSGFQAVGQRYFHNGNYVEARLGMDWIYGDITADFSMLYAWRVANMDWTYEGNWFLDIGAGAFFGGASNYFVFGAQGMGRLGYEFEDAPVSLAFDWSPSFGPEVLYSPRVNGQRLSVSDFNARGLANFGLSFIYRF
jgi:hypothetical protein